MNSFSIWNVFILKVSHQAFLSVFTDRGPLDTSSFKISKRCKMFCSLIKRRAPECSASLHPSHAAHGVSEREHFLPWNGPYRLLWNRTVLLPGVLWFFCHNNISQNSKTEGIGQRALSIRETDKSYIHETPIAFKKKCRFSSTSCWKEMPWAIHCS